MITNQDLIEAILDGSINDNLIETAKKQAEKIKSEREKQRKEAQEQRRLMQIEHQKPYYAIPTFDRNKGSKEILLEYREYLKTYDLDSIEVYLTELIEGLHKYEFRDVNEVIHFITLQINMRKSRSDSTEEKARLLKETKVELIEAKKLTQAMEQQIKETQKDLKSISETLKPSTQDKPKMEYSR